MTCRTTSPIASAPWTNARPLQPRPPDPWIGVDMDALFGSDGPTLPDPDPDPDPDPGIDLNAINGPMGPGIGM